MSSLESLGLVRQRDDRTEVSQTGQQITHKRETNLQHKAVLRACSLLYVNNIVWFKLQAAACRTQASVELFASSDAWLEAASGPSSRCKVQIKVATAHKLGMGRRSFLLDA